MPTPCTCGRPWDHCRVCGSRNIYKLLLESKIISASADQDITVWRCKKCMSATSLLTECNAGGSSEVTNFRSKEKALHEATTVPLADRIKKMIADGASVDDIKLEYERAGVRATIVDGDAAQPAPVIDASNTASQITSSQSEALPEGWTRDADGKIIAPLSMDDLFKAAKMDSNEEKK